MNPASPLQLGDRVEITGPGKMGNPSQIGQNFIIEKIKDGYYSDDHTAFWYPAGSLRKVEELRIGDWAEVILPDNPFTGKIGQVSSIGELTVALYDMGIWSRGSLRKLAPDEIQHGEPIKLSEEAKQKIENVIDEGIIKLLMEKTGARLSAIEERHDKIIDCLRGLATLTHGLAQIAELHEERFDDIDERQESIDSYISRIANVGAALEDRLAFVEAFQKGHVEETPCIDDVVSKILDEPALQKGDYVEVQRDGCGKKKGFVFCITYIETVESSICGPRTYYSANKLPMWTADELRKLSDEEINKRLNGVEEMQR
ncbi:hypothetical protein M0R72_19585 [Candidatus Pacearchaeota archaeon]|jgi:hypothetical protein|nr:hypothetical protein [Candidatus Pacearchaeota archaeon]